ncbi:hypothetical protein D3C72_1964370 [compost metagenome]
MTQNRGTRFALGFGFDVFCQLVHITDVFSDRDDGVFFAFRDTGFDFVNQVFTAELDFRHYDELAATSNGRRQGQVAAVTAHHFNDGNTLVRRRGVTQTVNRFNNRPEGREEADSVVGAFDVVIDSARQTDTWETHFSQAFCAHIRTVTADNH